MTEPDSTRLLALRRAVLGYLHARQSLAFKASHIRDSINFDGTDYTQAEVDTALTSLQKFGYTESKKEPLSPGVIRHEITGEGILFYEGS